MEKKTTNEIEEIRNMCNRNLIDFEHNGTKWEGCEGVVLFSLEHVWWLQKNPINPYQNISYNSVPPTPELTREKEGRSWIYIVGTSIMNQTLQVKQLEKRTFVEVALEKCFTISKRNATYKPNRNVKDVALERVKTEEFDWVVIECGINDISNLDPRKSESETLKTIEESVDELIEISVKMTRIQPGLRVVLLKQIERFDSRKKDAWRVKMNSILQEKVKVEFRTSGITVKDLNLPTKYKKQRDELFGEKGQDEWGKVDNIHLRGRKGKQIFTESMVKLVNSLKGGRSRSKVHLPRLQSSSMRPPGNTCTFSR